MTDDQRLKELLERRGRTPDSDREFDDLEEELGVSRQEIQAATTAVGHDRERVERYLRDRTGHHEKTGYRS